MTKVHTAGGERTAEVFVVNLLLPNGVHFTQCMVTGGEIAPSSDVLIGMDIITTGDFAITNGNGLTVMTFCCPSRRRFDFVKEHNDAMQAGAKSLNRP